MGSEAQATVRIGRKSYAGKALLETTELLFRGEIRLMIPLQEITAANARNGELKVTYSQGNVSFVLGDQAAGWAEKILHPKSRIDKLGVKTEHRVVLLNVEDAAFMAELRERTVSVSSGTIAKEADMIFLGATKLEELDRIPDVVPYMKRDGAVWTITPKGKGGLKDTDVMSAARGAGLVAVKVVAFSDTHSANKFVIPKADR